MNITYLLSRSQIPARADTLETIRALPKAKQHNHLVGSTLPETLLWLADQGDLEVPFETFEEVRDFFSYTDFDHFIRVYSTVVDCITKEDQFKRIASDILEAGHHCNVLDVEASFSAPDHFRKVSTTRRCSTPSIED